MQHCLGFDVYIYLLCIHDPRALPAPLGGLNPPLQSVVVRQPLLVRILHAHTGRPNAYNLEHKNERKIMGSSRWGDSDAVAFYHGFLSVWNGKAGPPQAITITIFIWIHWTKPR